MVKALGALSTLRLQAMLQPSGQQRRGPCAYAHGLRQEPKASHTSGAQCQASSASQPPSHLNFAQEKGATGCLDQRQTRQHTICCWTKVLILLWGKDEGN